jgi:hypothetical protein
VEEATVSGSRGLAGAAGEAGSWDSPGKRSPRHTSILSLSLRRGGHHIGTCPSAQEEEGAMAPVWVEPK